MAADAIFWDSCILTAYLKDEADIYDVVSISHYLEDAKKGKAVIYCSTLSAAEVLPSYLKAAPSFEEFMDDYVGAIVMIDPTPNVMSFAGLLRDLPYKKGNAFKRRLSTPDAIMLATAVHIREAYGIKLDYFHTYDGGGKKDLDGNKSIPMLGYETWCEDFTAAHLEIANKVISLNRCKPEYPTPGLPYVT